MVDKFKHQCLTLLFYLLNEQLDRNWLIFVFLLRDILHNCLGTVENYIIFIKLFIHKKNAPKGTILPLNLCDVLGL